MRVLRHDSSDVIGTNLDPIEDVLNFMTSLMSKGFTSDILRQKHGLSSVSEINKTAKLISLHVENALALSKQGLEGAPQTSFLPLYYSALNFIKVHLLFLGKRIDLEQNRWHGAKYSEGEMSRQFLNERIKILGKGTIPLLYKNLNNKAIPKSGIEISIEEVYGNISSIEAEYSRLLNKSPRQIAHVVNIVNDVENGHYLKIGIVGDEHKLNPPPSRQLKAFSKISLVQSADQLPYYASKKLTGDFNLAKSKLLKLINRNLLSDSLFTNQSGIQWYNASPINGRHHVFNEEMSILIAYFHLSNVIRYNPEHLSKLMDSKHWAIILGLRKHGFLNFLKLTWGNINRTSFDVF